MSLHFLSDFIHKTFYFCSFLECEEDEVISKPSNLSFWTPQTHRKSSQHPQHYQRNSRRRSTDRYQRKSEIFSAHKQNQYYSPQVSRRKSEFHYKNPVTQKKKFNNQYYNPFKPNLPDCHIMEASSQSIYQTVEPKLKKCSN